MSANFLLKRYFSKKKNYPKVTVFKISHSINSNNFAGPIEVPRIRESHVIVILLKIQLKN